MFLSHLKKNKIKQWNIHNKIILKSQCILKKKTLWNNQRKGYMKTMCTHNSKITLSSVFLNFTIMLCKKALNILISIFRRRSRISTEIKHELLHEWLHDRCEQPLIFNVHVQTMQYSRPLVSFLNILQEIKSYALNLYTEMRQSLA